MTATTLRFYFMLWFFTAAATIHSIRDLTVLNMANASCYTRFCFQEQGYINFVQEVGPSACASVPFLVNVSPPKQTLYIGHMM